VETITILTIVFFVLGREKDPTSIGEKRRILFFLFTKEKGMICGIGLETGKNGEQQKTN
jgi:hypothetical protein